jgi:hypothetical protein
MEKSATLEEARAAKARVLKELHDLPGLAGVGIMAVGAGYGVKINLKQIPAPNVELPSQIGQVPVVIEVIGVVSKRLPKVEIVA